MEKSIYSNEHKYIVKQLKKARLESKLDQQEIADKLGKTQSYISKVESGQSRIDIIQLKEFARLYKKPLDYFVR